MHKLVLISLQDHYNLQQIIMRLLNNGTLYLFPNRFHMGHEPQYSAWQKLCPWSPL